MTYFKSRLGLLKSVVQYLDLDSHNNFDGIKQNASKYKDCDGCLVYNFNVDIDLGIVFQQSAYLGTNILSMPIESAGLFQEVIFHFCQSNNFLPHETTPSQISPRLRITHFPSDSQNFQISSVSDLTKYLDYQGFVRLVGIVTGISGPAKYTQNTKYICPRKDCDGHVGNHYIRIHIPGASETNTIRSDFMCMFCGNTLEEVKSLRTLSDKIIVEIIPIHLQGVGQKETVRKGHMQVIPVFVRDEHVTTVMLGKAYEVIGICRKDASGEDIHIAIEANNITLLQRHLPPHLAVLPRALKDIYEKCTQSPWSFPFNVAYRFGDLITSSGAMIKLRLLLLMSLVLTPQNNLLHILVIGKETRLVYTLMKFAQQFAVRCFPSSSVTPLGGKVLNATNTWATYIIRCGTLLLSSGGVSPVGDVTGWRKVLKEQLQAVLTGNKIILDLASKHTGGLSQQIAFPLECHVWCIYDPHHSAKIISHKDDLIEGCSTGELTKSFLDSFSYICFLDSGNSISENEIMMEVTHQTLLSWCKPIMEDSESERVDPADWEQFLAVVRGIETKLSPEAEIFLQKYYTASRIARSCGLNGSDVPPSALYSLTSLATAFAKLNLKSYVDECDALMATFLYEESMAARYGLSVLSIQPQPHISKSQIKEFLGKGNDVAMKQFHIQIQRFCAGMVDRHSFIKEE